MARRQGGIHFSYLVVAVVMCVGLIGWSFVQNSDLNNAIEELNKKQTEVGEKEQSLRELSTKYDDLRRVAIGSDTREPDIAAMTEALRGAGQAAATAMGNNYGRDYTSFEETVADLVASLNHLKGLLDSQTSAARSKEEDALAHLRELDTVKATLNEEIAQLRSQINDLEKEKERVLAEARESETRLQGEIQTLEEEWSGRVYKLQRDLSISQGLLDQRDKRIEILEYEIKKEKTFAMVEPDGKVLRVEDELGFAWIDLGRDDRIRRGLIFDVFQYVKGGARLQKGRVEVARIESDFAEVKILETYDKFNPITAGDQIASPFYSGDDTPVFVFAGEKPVNRRLSREEIVQKIETFGGEVEAAVRLETDYVIAIQGYEETPEYKEARKLGITILREDELLDFIEQ